jgi:hypothetical protein
MERARWEEVGGESTAKCGAMNEIAKIADLYKEAFPVDLPPIALPLIISELQPTEARA